MLLFTFFEMIVFSVMISSFHLFISNSFDSLKEPQIATAVAGLMVYFFAWFTHAKPLYTDRTGYNSLFNNNTNNNNNNRY